MRSNGKLQHSVRVPPVIWLLAFEGVVRHGSFSLAADELSVTQSAISHRIRQLESLIGVSLLLRVGHKVTLTPKGRELLPYIRDGIGCLKDGIAKMSAAGRPSIRLSLAPAIAANWLIQRLAAFQRIHPEINLDILVTSKMLNLRAGDVDIGIRFGKGKWDGVDAIKLISAKLIAVCSPAYKKAHHGLKVPSDLAKATLLRATIVTWRPWFEAAGIDLPEPQAGPSFSEVSLLINAAEFSQGVALTLDVLVERQLSEKTLVRLFDIALESERSYYIVTATGKEQSTELQAFIDWLLRS